MLDWLKKEQKGKNFNAQQLHAHWHEIMEPKGARDGRQSFFSEVVERANSASHCFYLFRVALTAFGN
jgi:hypothetical protein